MKKASSFQISKKLDPHVVRARILGLCIFLVTLAAAIYLFGQWRAGYLSTNYEVTFKELNAEINELRKDRDAYLSKSVDMESALKIEQEVVADLRTRILEVNAENGELKQELGFYTSLLDPSQEKRGLHINHFSVSSDQFTGALIYRLILAQIRGADRFVSGDAIIEIKGSIGDQVVTLPMNQVVADSVDKETFRFKYFQTIESELDLPENFSPTDVRVLVESTSRRVDSIQKVYAWNDITIRGND